MQRRQIVDKLRELRPALNAEGVTHIALFGSRARGDHNAASDLDLLLDVDPGGRFSLLNLVGVEQIVEDAVGIRANAFMRRSLNADFRRSVDRDLVDVF